MIAYVTIGTNDLPRAAVFYDAIAGELGAGRYLDMADRIGWGTLQGGGIIVMKPFNGDSATVGNGAMVSLAAKDKAQVDRIHKLALANGGSDEGEPGPRAGGGFYAAYFRDLDGNKLNAFVLGG
jgi:catechol 2,3-dioxygenase-like lactoylglutathione lyase family enzyme